MSIINTNISALVAQNNMKKNDSSLSTVMERLSSGLRINSAKDDAAGLAITERQTAQIKAFNQAIRNANDGVSFVQSAESSLVEVTNNLQRMRELAVQSANGVYTRSDRVSMQKEISALQEEIGRSLQSANFNGVGIFYNSANTNFISSVGFQIGANAGVTPNSQLDFNRIQFDMEFDIVDANGTRGSVNGFTLGGAKVAFFDAMVSAKIFGYDSTSGIFGGSLTNTAIDAGSVLSVTTLSGAQYAINWIDSALNAVNDVRASFGSLNNRFESTIRNLNDMSEATTAARSRIRDADYAAETAELAKQQILQQAGIAMLAMSKNAQQNILSLLQ